MWEWRTETRPICRRKSSLMARLMSSPGELRSTNEKELRSILPITDGPTPLVMKRPSERNAMKQGMSRHTTWEKSALLTSRAR
jgi:hypothetical protein